MRSMPPMIRRMWRAFSSATISSRKLSDEAGRLVGTLTVDDIVDVIQEEARRSGQHFVTNRWLGGTLTNFRTVKGSLERLRSIEKMAEDGTLERLTKKEALQLDRERGKLEKSLGGIKQMQNVPGAIFVIDPAKLTSAEGVEIVIDAVLNQFDENFTLEGAAVASVLPMTVQGWPVSTGDRTLLCFVGTIMAQTLFTI